MTTPLDDSLPSKAQQEWEVVADTLRGHVARMANLDLVPADVMFVINAAAAAYLFDLQARSFDSRLDTILGNQYGGNCEHQ